MQSLSTVNPAMFVGTLSYVLYAVLAICLVFLIAKRSVRKAKAK
jgi:hypothetical protein